MTQQLLEHGEMWWGVGVGVGGGSPCLNTNTLMVEGFPRVAMFGVEFLCHGTLSLID